MPDNQNDINKEFAKQWAQLSEYERAVRVGIAELTERLREARQWQENPWSFIRALTGIVEFLEIFPHMNTEHLIGTISIPLGGLIDLQNGKQADWLKPIPMPSGRKKTGFVEHSIKIHTVMMVLFLQYLGDKRKDAIVEVRKSLLKADYAIEPQTINKWVSEYSTMYKEKDEKKRIRNLVEGLKAQHAQRTDKPSRAPYLSQFTSTIKERLKSK